MTHSLDIMMDSIPANFSYQFRFDHGRDRVEVFLWDSTGEYGYKTFSAFESTLAESLKLALSTAMEGHSPISQRAAVVKAIAETSEFINNAGEARQP